MHDHNENDCQKDKTESLMADLNSFQEEVKKVVQIGLKSKTAEIRLLLTRITALNEAGYSQEKLRDVMSQGGLEITLGTLKSLLSRVRQNSAKKTV